MKYVLPAGVIAAFASVLPNLTRESVAATATAALPAVSARGLPMLAIPIVVIVLLVAKQPLLEGLLFGILPAAVVALGFGLLSPSKLLYLARAAFVATGIMNRGIGASVFTILLVGLVATLQATEALERVVH